MGITESRAQLPVYRTPATLAKMIACEIANTNAEAAVNAAITALQPQIEAQILAQLEKSSDFTAMFERLQNQTNNELNILAKYAESVGNSNAQLIAKNTTIIANDVDNLKSDLTAIKNELAHVIKMMGLPVKPYLPVPAPIVADNSNAIAPAPHFPVASDDAKKNADAAR